MFNLLSHYTFNSDDRPRPDQYKGLTKFLFVPKGVFLEEETLHFKLVSFIRSCGVCSHPERL